MTKNVSAIYVRVSSHQQKDEETIKSQLDALIEYVEQNKLEVPSGWIFQDNGYSGSTLDRPGLDELRDLVQEGVITSILVYSPDRLSRRYVDQLILEEEFRKNHVKIVYLKGAKSDKPEEQMTQHLQGIFAEYERSQILDRSRRGKLYKARQGMKNVLPSAPYGYVKSRDDFYAIESQSAKVVLMIFDLYANKAFTLRGVAKYLEQMNISSPSGRLVWSPTTIRDILKNSAYIGTAYYGKTEKSEGDVSRIAHYSKAGKVTKTKYARLDKHKDQWLPIQVTPIVDNVIFENAQRILVSNSMRASRNTKEPSILQGILICGLCSRPFYKRSYCKNGKKTVHYTCSTRLQKSLESCGNISVPQGIIDELVWKKILEVIEDPQLIKNEIQRRIDDNPKEKMRIKCENEIEKELKKIKNAKNKIIDAYQETECFDIKELNLRLKKLSGKENELIRDLESLKSLSILKEKNVELEVTLNEFRLKLHENAVNLSVQEKQNIIRSLVEEVIVMPEEITINHTISLSPYRNHPLRSVCVG